jgi:hypothetical protein
MVSPVSARVAPELRKRLTEYCAAHGISQTQAIEEGLKLLLSQPPSVRALTPEVAVENLKRRGESIRIAFDIDVAKAEGRD